MLVDLGEDHTGSFQFMGAFLHTWSLSYQGTSVKVVWWCFFHSADVETGTDVVSYADNRPRAGA